MNRGRFSEAQIALAIKPSEFATTEDNRTTR